MKIHPVKIVLLVVFVSVNLTSAHNHLSIDMNYPKIHYQDGNVEPSFEVEPLKEGIRPVASVLKGLGISFIDLAAVRRDSGLLRTTIASLLTTTKTVISTFTSTTTCTTSTASLVACPIGSRRRSFEIDGFLSNENEGHSRDDKSFQSPELTHKPLQPAEPVVAAPSPPPLVPTTATRPPPPISSIPPYLPPVSESSFRPPSPTQASSSMFYPPTLPVVAEIPFPSTPRPIGPSPPRPFNPSSLPPVAETPRPYPTTSQEPPGISYPPTVPVVAETQLPHYSAHDIPYPPLSVTPHQLPTFEHSSTSQPALPGIEPSLLNDRDGLHANRFELVRLLPFGTSTVTRYLITTTTVSLTATCSRTTGFETCGSNGK